MLKTVAEFVSSGISNLSDLQAALQLAMQLEFSTIPPYLCAEWSINDDPDDVADIVHEVVIQEMYHFAAAGNLLSAIGGTTKVANSSFVPHYPTNILPGGIAQELSIDLQPLSKEQLQVFMQIEKPEFPPVALMALTAPPATIGAFYDTMCDGFANVQPAINTTAHALLIGPLRRIQTVDDALAAVRIIKQEGEGTPLSPDQPASDNGQLAHYYLFKEVFIGNTLVQTGESWSFSGPAIRMPTIFQFAASNAAPDPSLAFNRTLAALLRDLEGCWITGQAFSRNNMDNLEQLGTGLIQQGIRPAFRWAD